MTKKEVRIRVALNDEITGFLQKLNCCSNLDKSGKIKVPECFKWVGCLVEWAIWDINPVASFKMIDPLHGNHGRGFLVVL